MSADVERIVRWLDRARPPRGRLSRALIAGTIASLTNVGLLVGAAGLLVASAARPGLRAVSGALIAIELLAFLRSPLRFSERLSAHRLGFEAVTQWRRWLVASIGRWDYARWRQHASGDLLERSLRDTDELQDLWLRCGLPVLTTGATMVTGDVIVGFLPAHGQWWCYAGTLFATQAVACALLFSNLPRLVRADRALRHARGSYQATLVELSATTPDLALLGRGDYSEARLSRHRTSMELAEAALDHARRLSQPIPVVGTLVALAALWLAHPQTSPTWLVVAGVLAVSTAESLSTIRSSVDTAVAVSAAGERLEQLESDEFALGRPWPLDPTLRVEHLDVAEGDSTLVHDASFTVAPGRRVAITGRSGVGKSTLLRALSGLDAVASGSIRIGDVEVGEFGEDVLRSRLAYLVSEPGLTRGHARDVVRMGRPSEREVARDLQALGISVDDTTRFAELSRGERQRVAIARALVTSPSILVLDEPTSGLGRSETLDVLALLDATKATIIVATHDPSVVAWSDDVYELSDSVLRKISR